MTLRAEPEGFSPHPLMGVYSTTDKCWWCGCHTDVYSYKAVLVCEPCYWDDKIRERKIKNLKVQWKRDGF